jgi:hypothetical protein
MDILQKIIELMTKEELRNYTLMAARWGGTEDRKDLELFKYFRKAGEKANERKIMRQLYGAKGENPYYRLKNRLFTEVSRSLTMLHWDHNAMFLALHFLEMALLYRDKQEYEVAHHFLKKAERKALEIEKLELLEMIYSEFISISFAVPDIDPGKYIALQEENGKRLGQLRKIDHILAVASYRIRKTQNLGAGDSSLVDLLKQTIDEFSGDLSLKKSPQFRLRMYEAVSKLLLQRRDYQALENYLQTTYSEFTTDGIFTRENHEVHLQMVTYMVNALFKNRKFQEALEYADVLKNLLDQYGKLHADKYQFFYHSALASIYSELDASKSIKILEELMEDEGLSKLPLYQFFIFPNLAMMQYKQKNLRKTIQTLVKLNLQEAFANADPSLKLKIAVFEIAVRYEMGEPDVVESRLGQTQRDFSDLLAREEFATEGGMLKLINLINNSPDPAKDEHLCEAAQQFMQLHPEAEGDLLRYHEWLQRILKLPA